MELQFSLKITSDEIYADFLSKVFEKEQVD